MAISCRLWLGLRAKRAFRNSISLGILSLLLGFAKNGLCDVALSNGTSFAFATVADGQHILRTQDDFVERMSPFDRAARMKTDRVVSVAEYLLFAATNVMAWSYAEKSLINAGLAQLKPRLDAFSLPFPKTVYLVKTTGREEGDAQYTRTNAIMLNAGLFATDQKVDLAKVLAHEMFHVLSRQNPELRERCYSVIGFKKCDEVSLPVSLGLPRITNPDAPKNNHFIEVSLAGRGVDAIPVIYSRTANYDVQKSGEFFDYLEFKFLVVARPAAAAPPNFGESDAQLVEPDQLAGFMEQIGRNTQYIIHPEEILADNFSLLVRDQTAPSPEILKKLAAALKGTP